MLLVKFHTTHTPLSTVQAKVKYRRFLQRLLALDAANGSGYSLYQQGGVGGVAAADRHGDDGGCKMAGCYRLGSLRLGAVTRFARKLLRSS